MLESFCIGKSHQQLCISKGLNTSLKRNKENWTNRANPQQSQSARSAADRTLPTDTRSEGGVWGWGRGKGKGKLGRSERVAWTYIHYQM